MKNLVKVYHRLPYPLRVLAASCRGYYLRWLRYGPETKKLMEEALGRETWNAGDWKTWQEKRLTYILHRAATKVPYYRKYWLERRRRGDHASWALLENWPVLKKETVRANPEAFVADDCDIRYLYCNHTSGTTGTPVNIYFSRSTSRGWYALFEARFRQWHDVSIRQRWGMLGVQLVVPQGQTRPPFWVRNWGLNQVYFSTNHIAPWSAEAYLRAIQEYGLTHLITYTSSLCSLASELIEQGMEFPVKSSLKIIFTNAEPLFSFQREMIERVFGCSVCETYGQGEMVLTAGECKKGSLHLWPESGIVEVFADQNDVSLPTGQTGRFICTGLHNAEMLFIRYEVGDRGSLAPPETVCSCGRSLPILQNVEGRMDDVILTGDGRRVWTSLNSIMSDLCIRKAQVIQESRERLRVLFVPAPGYVAADTARIIAGRLKEIVGKDMEIVLEKVENIPRNLNGKFRAQISLLKDK